jgi:methylthioribose-1-phosphate isomerase
MKSIEWLGDRVRFIDQTALPLEELYLETHDYTVLSDAIRTLKIRGAPLIGITAAYGVVLASISFQENDINAFCLHVHKAIDELASTRPTAVNLFWALQRMKRILDASSSIHAAKTVLTAEALSIHKEDEEMCRRIGEHGSTLVPQHATILTHCNTGALATGGEGTAQSIITTAHGKGKSVRVYADETRPLFQGARLTMWELMKAGIDATLITDGMGPFLMQQGKIDLVVTGADRIAANGDAANKVGTYSLAVNARHHGIPFYIAAPSSTIDGSIRSGKDILVEERSPDEITNGFGKRTAPVGSKVYSPAFDITPASLITAIITEQGVHRAPFHFDAINSNAKHV